MKRFKNILVVCDDDASREDALDRGLWLARANGARVTLLDVIETGPGALRQAFTGLSETRATEIEAQVIAYYTDRLAALAAPFREAGLAVSTAVTQGVGFIEVIRTVLRDAHDIVIKGARSGGKSNRFSAGIDLHLLRKCPCPVWMLKAGQPKRTERILAAIDPDPIDPSRDTLNRMTMELAASLAEQDEAELHVINAWHLPEEGTLRSGRFAMPEKEIVSILEAEKRAARARLAAFLERFPDTQSNRSVVLEKGFAGDVIPDYAVRNGIDTVVMGTVGRSGVRGLFIGNTAETILGAVPCSVMAIKPPDFLTPVGLNN
ncbi:MAG: universal stress protein [Pseudomonadota bacterium]